MKSERFIFPVTPSTKLCCLAHGILSTSSTEQIGPAEERLHSARMAGSMNTIGMQELQGISGHDRRSGAAVLVAKPDDKEKQ